ncbi:hypothetical protein ELI75_31005 [Klebsiella pneumoniae]|nr:hypothetical protein [Klebsiella pneumoniae]
MEGLWDDVVAGPHPEYGLGDFKKKFTTKPLIIKGSLFSELICIT